MSIPVTYTETTLAEYMHAELGKMAQVLGYGAPSLTPGDYQEQVNEVALELGISDMETAHDIRKVRALARREAWKKALNDLTSKYDFSSDGSSYSRSQMTEQAQASFERAEHDCMSLGLSGNTVYMDSMTYRNDPYGYPKNPEDLC
jgi:hypothetical protein